MNAENGHWDRAKSQVAHVLFGSLAFIAIAVVAVVLDLFSSFCETLPITAFTSTIIAWVSHAMLLIDAVLFLAFLVSTGIDQLKAMKND
jgi:hypothetical protein